MKSKFSENALFFILALIALYGIFYKVYTSVLFGRLLKDIKALEDTSILGKADASMALFTSRSAHSDSGIEQSAVRWNFRGALDGAIGALGRFIR